MMEACWERVGRTTRLKFMILKVKALLMNFKDMKEKNLVSSAGWEGKILSLLLDLDRAARVESCLCGI